MALVWAFGTVVLTAWRPRCWPRVWQRGVLQGVVTVGCGPRVELCPAVCVWGGVFQALVSFELATSVCTGFYTAMEASTFQSMSGPGTSGPKSVARCPPLLSPSLFRLCPSLCISLLLHLLLLGLPNVTQECFMAVILLECAHTLPCVSRSQTGSSLSFLYPRLCVRAVRSVASLLV